MPYPIIIKIKDEEGDLIPGSGELYGIKNTIVGYAFKHHVSLHLDYDASTNEEIKIIQYNPFYFVKEVDKTSPVLNQYLVTQDKLKEVEILYFMHDRTLGDDTRGQDDYLILIFFNFFTIVLCDESHIWIV